jgi:hypothetical protein
MEVGGEVHSREKPPVSIGYEVGWARVSLDAMEKRKILHCREQKPGRPARSPSCRGAEEKTSMKYSIPKIVSFPLPI